MPKFGKRDSSKPNKIFTLKKVNDKLAKIKYKFQDWNWNASGTPLRLVNSRLNKRLIPQVEKLNRSKGPKVVVDWGCDNGKALIEFAKKFPKVSFVGFSQESHQDWVNVPKNITFLHTNTRAIEKLANKPSIKGRVGVLYSHYGLHHISKQGGQAFVDHVLKLSAALKKGGKIIIRPGEFYDTHRSQIISPENELVKILSKQFKPVFIQTPTIWGTKQALVELIKK